jgi:hypothetical protein
MRVEGRLRGAADLVALQRERAHSREEDLQHSQAEEQHAQWRKYLRGDSARSGGRGDGFGLTHRFPALNRMTGGSHLNG